MSAEVAALRASMLAASAGTQSSPRREGELESATSREGNLSMSSQPVIIVPSVPASATPLPILSDLSLIEATALRDSSRYLQEAEAARVMASGLEERERLLEEEVRVCDQKALEAGRLMDECGAGVSTESRPAVLDDTSTSAIDTTDD